MHNCCCEKVLLFPSLPHLFFDGKTEEQKPRGDLENEATKKMPTNEPSNFRIYCACTDIIIMKILLPIRHAEDARSSPSPGVNSFMCRNIKAATNADSSTAYLRLLLGHRRWPQTPFSPMLEAGPHIPVIGLSDALVPRPRPAFCHLQ